MSGVSSVVIKIGAQTAEAVAGIKNVDKALGSAQTTGEKFQSAIGKAAIPAAAALTVLSAAAIKSAHAAAEDQESRALLDSQLKRSTDATRDVIAANEDWVDSASRSAAVSKEELRPALAGLVRTTGDVTKAHQLMALALDTAAATGKPLATVTAAIAKGYGGSASSLKRLVPSISDAAIKSGNWAKVQAELNKQVHGAAAADAKTAAGQYRELQISMQELQVTIGTALLPVLQAFLPVATRVFDVAAGHSEVFIALAGAVAVVAAAILALNAAIGAYNTVTKTAELVSSLWNSAQLRSAIVLAATKVQLVAYAVASKVARTATAIFTAAQWLLNAALDANPIGIAVVALAALAAGLYLAYRHSATFRGMVNSAFSEARQHVLLLLGPMGLIADGLILLYQHSSTFRNVVVGAFQAVLRAINDVIDAVGSLVGKISGIHFPSKPSWLPLGFPVPSSLAGAAPLAAGAGVPVININVSGAIDPESTAIAIRRALTRYDRRRGRPLGTAGQGAT